MTVATSAQAQRLLTKPFDSSALPNGISFNVFSSMMIAMNNEDEEAYYSFVLSFLDISTTDAIKLLDVSVQAANASNEFSEVRLREYCDKDHFSIAINEGESTTVLDKIDDYRNDVRAYQENKFIDLLLEEFDKPAAQRIVAWITSDFKSTLTVKEIDEKEMVDSGQIDIRSKVRDMCAF
jgi:hypothetical protein